MQDFTVVYSASADSVTLTKTDGTTDTYVNQATAAAPVVQPTDTEVDLLMSDGSTKKFVPAD